MTLTPYFPQLLARKSVVKVGLGLFLAAILFFQLYPSLDSYFMADDFGWLRFGRSHSHVLDAAMQPSLGDWTTPLSNVVFWSLFRSFRHDPRGYFVVIAVIHLVNAWLVFHLVSVVARRKIVGAGAAFIFALHFIHFSDWGPLVWISAFVQVVMATFYLASLVLFTRYERFRRNHYYVAALICFALALAAKETAVTLPLLLAAWCVLGLLPFERRWKQTAILLAPFFIVLGVYLLYKLLFQQTSGRYLEEGLYGLGPHLLSNWKYFSNFLMPNPESPPVRSFLLRAFPASVLTVAELALVLSRIALLVIGVVLWWRGPKHMRMWILLAVVTYLPFIAFLDGNAGANRYFYLPAVGLSALLAEGLWRLFYTLREQRGTALSTLIMVLLLLSFWAYGLVPIRSWQKQMQSNTQLSQQVISALDEHLPMRAPAATSGVYLEGFSSEEFHRLQRIIRLVYGIDVIMVAEEAAVKPPVEALVLLYKSDQVTMRRP
jgi:hypothetical protein